MRALDEKDTCISSRINDIERYWASNGNYARIEAFDGKGSQY